MLSLLPMPVLELMLIRLQLKLLLLLLLLLPALLLLVLLLLVVNASNCCLDNTLFQGTNILCIHPMQLTMGTVKAQPGRWPMETCAKAGRWPMVTSKKWQRVSNALNYPLQHMLGKLSPERLLPSAASALYRGAPARARKRRSLAQPSCSSKICASCRCASSPASL